VHFDFENDQRLRVKIEIEKRGKKQGEGREERETK